MAITTVLDAPLVTDTPAVFNTKAFAFAAALNAYASEANAMAAAMNLNSTTDTSLTSNAIGTGAKTFTVSTGKSFQPGMYLVIADSAAPSTNSMFVQVTSYSGSTLIVHCISYLGSGTKTAWVISQSSAGGAAFTDTHGKNLVVNGSCQVSKDAGSTLTTTASGDYPIDNCAYVASDSSKLQHQRVSNVLNSLGATNALTTSVLSSFTPISTSYFYNAFMIEGHKIENLQYGTANARHTSLQFKARASVAGTYSGSIRNNAGDRSYPFSFTLLADTDTLVKIEGIPGDTTGTWPTTNSRSMLIVFDLGSGTNFKSTANAWSAGTYFGVTGATNLVSQVNGSTLSITDVQLEEGIHCTGFDRKSYDIVFDECQRYYPSISGVANTVAGVGMSYTATTAKIILPFPVIAMTEITGLVASGAGILSCRKADGILVAATGISFSKGSVNQVEIELSGLSGFVAGNATNGLFNTTGTIKFTGARM